MTDRRKGILIVEDENEIRTLLALVLDAEGFTVYEARDGEEALAVLRNHDGRVDLMITDLGLPKLGGIELIEQVRASYRAMKIVGSSGYSRHSIREEVLNAGADAFLAKPFLTDEVVKFIRQLLG